MSSAYFQVQEHVVPCQHIREFPRATANSQEEVLHLAVKQYRPLDNTNPKPGDVTIIGAHANGFPKELYEPLWDEILHRSSDCGIRIRNIWIADVSNQGASGVMNEDELGNDPSWGDHPRDLLLMINHFRDQMPRPLVGMGHSMGSVHLVFLSLLHPRLFSTLILMDPVIQPATDDPSPFPPTRTSTFRRDIWPSRIAATEAVNNNKFYQKWDDRVRERWLDYGLRDLPTPLYPDKSSIPDAEKPVTLTTSKHQEVFVFLRPNFGDPKSNHGDDVETIIDRTTYPGMDDSISPPPAFYRPETIRAWQLLPFVRPSVLYIFGGDSPNSRPQYRREKIERTGTGVGGSGGSKQGRVDEVVLDGVGHLVAMEAVNACAEAAVPWLGREIQRWRDGEAAQFEEWRKRYPSEKAAVNEEWKKMITSGSQREYASKALGSPKL
ncbi:MAG: hypothetical protein M1819_000120 [Sarea resinae]|nr:MAG: hypothetical protein M1819_000120 [Sarea resinae]